MIFTVLHDRWRLHPLAWIHRGEARRIARELRACGHTVSLAAFGPGPRVVASHDDRLILRLSDPVMFEAVEALSSARVPYIGPSFEAMKRCYDKYSANRIVAAAGCTCPPAELASHAERIDYPAVLKPRFGSDSIGVRRVAGDRLPARKRNDDYIVQRYVVGAEITIGVLKGQVGAPLRVRIPEGTLYTFARKYALRPGIVPVAERSFAERVRIEALRIATALDVNWAARVDFIHERGTDLLYFLECDVAPLVGPGSAFDTSLEAAGVARMEQLKLLF